MIPILLPLSNEGLLQRPQGGYALLFVRASDGALCTLDPNGVVAAVGATPAASLSAKVTVANQAARFALTTAQVQNGDYVFQTDTSILYEVTDQTALNGAGGYTAQASVTAAQISDATAVGRAFLIAADLAAQLALLGGGVAPTGTGALVRSTSPTLVTPALGAAGATSLALASGSAGAPSVTFGDSDTGFYGSGALVFLSINGTAIWGFGANEIFANNVLAVINCGAFVAANRPVITVGDFTAGLGCPANGSLSLVCGNADRVVISAAGMAIGGGAAIAKVLSNVATLDFGSAAAQISEDLTITVTDAAVGDTVFLATPAAPAANTSFLAFVSAADTVTVRHNNYSAGAVDPASGSYRVTVFKH